MTPGSSLSTQSFICAPGQPTEEHELTWTLLNSFSWRKSSTPLSYKMTLVSSSRHVIDDPSVKVSLSLYKLDYQWHDVCCVVCDVQYVTCDMCRHIRISIKERNRHSHKLNRKIHLQVLSHCTCVIYFEHCWTFPNLKLYFFETVYISSIWSQPLNLWWKSNCKLFIC